MSLLFLQALIADLVHVERVQHAYCPIHKEITHDVEHVHAVHASYNASNQLIEHGGLALPTPAPLKGDHNDSPFDCGELLWLAAETDATFAPSFDLAAPVPVFGSLLPTQKFAHKREHHPAIALHFHASGLSPPVLS